MLAKLLLLSLSSLLLVPLALAAGTLVLGIVVAVCWMSVVHVLLSRLARPHAPAAVTERVERTLPRC